jgi:O-Antigen ligase
MRKMSWTIWLWLYIGYAVLIALLLNAAIFGVTYLPFGVEQITNLAKLVIGGFFLVSVINWASLNNGLKLRRQLDWVLHCSFFLTLVQLLVYEAHNGFGQIIAGSSSEAAEMYVPSLCFWGIPDKNVFGARIALFGFLYLFNYFIWTRRFPLSRTILVLTCAFLSNSRTPMAALFLGIAYVLFRKFRYKGKIALIAAIAAISPFLLIRLLRVDSLFDTSDGFGIRIIYWSTFFTHFSNLPQFGSGFMSGGKFLSDNSPIYLGEPHLHNLFLNNYLDFGIPGFVAYIGFLVALYRFCKRDSKVWFPWYWTAAFLPLLSIMSTLSTGYESDTWVYLAAVYVIGHSAAKLQISEIQIRQKPQKLAFLRRYTFPSPSRTGRTAVETGREANSPESLVEVG